MRGLIHLLAYAIHVHSNPFPHECCAILTVKCHLLLTTCQKECTMLPLPNPDPCAITYLIRLIGQSPITLAFPQRANFIKCQATPPFTETCLFFFACCATTGCTLNPE